MVTKVIVYVQWSNNTITGMIGMLAILMSLKKNSSVPWENK